jgi:hypothetical protein
MTDTINTYSEKSLHAALKSWYAREGGQMEVHVDGYIVDVVRPGLLIEVQTGNFANIKTKLLALSDTHNVLLVYPVPVERWLVTPPGGGKPGSTAATTKKPSRRRSPKCGTAEDLFPELVRLPAELIRRPTFSIEIAFIREDELRHYDARKGWRRRGWVSDDRILLDVVDRRRFTCPADFAALLPAALPADFTTTDLAKALRRPRWLAQKMAYCLREMEVIEQVGHRKRSYLYRRRAIT